MTSPQLRLPLSPKPKHLLSLLRHQMACYRSLNLNLSAIPKIPKGTLSRNATSNRAAHTYSIVDDLA